MARRRAPRLIVAVLSLAGLVVAIGQSVLIPVLPDLPMLLGVSLDSASWLVTMTLVAGAVSVPSVSRLADMYGKRRMIVACLAVVTLGSALGALTESFALVLAGRMLQGVGLALIPVGIAIMRDELPRERLGSAVALMSATLGIGVALGLPLSGVIYLHLGWHALFWVSGALAAGLLVAVALVVPESPIRTAGRFDLLGAVMLSCVLVLLLLGITKGSQWGWASSTTLGCLAIAAALLCLWVPWELRTGQPVVDLRASAARPVLLTNIASLLAGFAMYTNLLTATEVLQLPESTGYGFGKTAMQAGMLMLPVAVMMVLASPASAAITRRRGAKTTLVLGTVLLAGGYLVRLGMVSSPAQVVLGAMVVTVGTSITYSAIPVLIMRSVPVTETAAANGLNTLVRTIGMATASAAVAATLTTLTMSVDGAVLPSADAFQRAHLLASVAAALAAAVALALPRHRDSSTDEARDPVLDAEAVVHGLVVDARGRPVPHAQVRVITGQAGEVDWAACDEQGGFWVVVPTGTGYTIVAVTSAGAGLDDEGSAGERLRVQLTEGAQVTP